MTQDRELSQDEARVLITRLLGRDAQVTLHPFEFGWLARRVLTEEELSRGMQLGQGSHIIDRTGVVTEQRSLAVPLLIEEYSAARRQGRISGRQVWPVPDTAPPTR